MPALRTGQSIGRYTVQSLIKENTYTQTYRVEDADQTPYFLKLFITKLLPAKLLNTETGGILEIEAAAKLHHRNIIAFIESGVTECDEGSAHYYVASYLSGEILKEKIRREGKLPEEEAIAIYRDVLNGLQYMHENGLCHNDITPSNIMLSDKTGGVPEIIDMGHLARPARGKVCFDTSDLDIFYQANETFGGMYDEQGDIFAATAVLYTMLFGKAPWTMDFDPAMRPTRRAILLKEHRKEKEPDMEGVEISQRTRAILLKGLAPAYQDRYSRIQSVINDLESDKEPEPPKKSDTPSKSDGGNSGQGDGRRRSDDIGLHDDFEIKHGNGNGFADIAGMQDLKDYLTKRVLFAIKNKEKMESYRITPINALLLWGPPGCGKSFVAEKFAEESGYSYMWIKSSDLASSYVHGSQQRIAHLFEQARKNAPVVICFDEFDALVPDRSSYAAKDMSSEVNEFLTQLNNCSQRGIFVIGTTNRPDKIDPAVLRTGRVDKQVYVPMPDLEARREIFRLHLKGRPLDEASIDYDKLASLTEGYIASDIAYIVNDAALMAAYTDQPINEDILETSVGNTHPSLRKDMLLEYDEIKKQMEGAERRLNAGRHVVKGF